MNCHERTNVARHGRRARVQMSRQRRSGPREPPREGAVDVASPNAPVADVAGEPSDVGPVVAAPGQAARATGQQPRGGAGPPRLGVRVDVAAHPGRDRDHLELAGRSSKRKRRCLRRCGPRIKRAPTQPGRDTALTVYLLQPGVQTAVPMYTERVKVQGVRARSQAGGTGSGSSTATVKGALPRSTPAAFTKRSTSPGSFTTSPARTTASAPTGERSRPGWNQR